MEKLQLNRKTDFRHFAHSVVEMLSRTVAVLKMGLVTARWEEIKSMIMKTSKVWHCPVCGEKLSFFDRTHVREKHPEYYHAVRKWQLASSLSLISGSVFLIINGLSANWFVKWLAVDGELIAFVLAFVFLLKWLSVANKHKVS